MIKAIVRSPSSFFDSISSGLLVNKFSNDLGSIDNSLILSFIDAFEGPLSLFIALLNICQINGLMTIPAIIISIISILFFLYARPAIIKTKELSIQAKSPIFHFYNESIGGLIPIRLYGQRMNRM